MPKRKYVNKIKVAPRTDANQGIREHNERVRKQREYYAKKMAEYIAKQKEERERAQALAATSTSQTLDGLGKDDTSTETI